MKLGSAVSQQSALAQNPAAKSHAIKVFSHFLNKAKGLWHTTKNLGNSSWAM